MEQILAIRSSDLVDRFGVATHMAYTDGGYRELSTILNALRYLGIDNVRDDAPNPAWDAYGQAHIAQAAAAGIDFTFYAQGWIDPATVVARIHAIEQATPGSVTAIEGPNEVNNWPVSYKGLTGTPAAQAYMRDLFNAVQADPLLRDLPVTGFTDYPNHSSTSDASAIHSYTKEGDQPFATMVYDMAAQERVDPGKPFYITETGYHTKINPSYGWEGVSEAVQAKLVLNTYMDGVLLGAKQVYIYQLLDAYAGNSQEEYFGLFRLDKSPKPAATAIHNLTTILADIGTTAETFATQTLDFTVTNAPTTGHTMLSQKSNGTWQIITWAEPDIWNEATNQAINVAPTSQKISFAQTFQKIEIFDPLLGTSPIRTFTNVSSVNVDVTDHPIIVQLSGGAGAAAVGGAATSGDLHAVYRFFDAGNTREHFYTTSAAERDAIINNLPSYQYEGVHWATPDKSVVGAVDVYRFFNTVQRTHLFTRDIGERDSIIENLPGMVYEGVSFQAYSGNTNVGGQLSLKRFFDPTRGDHHFAPPAEASAIQNGSAGPNWVDEGPGLMVHVIDSSIFIG